MRKLIWLTLMAFLVPAAAAPAEEFDVMLFAHVFVSKPVHGGTLHVAQVIGDGRPTGPVEGFTGFVRNGARIQDGLTVLADEAGDVLFLVFEGQVIGHSLFEGTAAVVGGTGPWANATGALTFSGEEVVRDEITFVFVGTIER